MKDDHPIPGTVRTRRWNDPAGPADGTRILVCRYRPRALRKEHETWHAWVKELGPSKELHARLYGKSGTPPTWAEFERLYVAEMAAQREQIAELARRVAAGETVTLLCSSACTDETRCHRTLLRRLIEEAMGPGR
jgi:uncharacterized protein YeaO (DUF488 family)